MKVDKILILPDTHAPYHNQRAFDLVLQVSTAIKPTSLVVLGDFADCASISSHSKDPARLSRFQSELDCTNTLLDRLDSIKTLKRKHYLLGNHEVRLQRYIQDNAPELSGLQGLTVPALLRLPERSFHVTPYRQTLNIGHFSFSHDVDRASGASGAKRARDTYESNAVIGHTHHMVVHYCGNAKGKTHVGATFGWLGDKNQIDYMHSVSVARSWQLGFGLGYLLPSGIMHIQAVPIIVDRNKYTCVVEGNVYEG